MAQGGSARTGTAFVGRSPGRLAWGRLKADRVAMASGVTLIVLMVVALAAPLIETGYGIGPHEQFQHKLSSLGGIPYGYLGGVSGEHWFGLEPGLGRDIFIRMVYGMRTSLFIALAAALITTAIGVVLGTVAGYVGGRWTRPSRGSSISRWRCRSSSWRWPSYPRSRCASTDRATRCRAGSG